MNFRITGLDAAPGFPDRVTMREVEPGNTVLLLNHVCQPAPTPYRASHAIFVREGASDTYDRVNEVPEVMRTRLLAQRSVARVHAHDAKRGCYAGRIARAC